MTLILTTDEIKILTKALTLAIVNIRDADTLMLTDMVHNRIGACEALKSKLEQGIDPAARSRE